MASITAIKPQKRPGWFNVFVDGRFAFSLPDTRIASEGIGVGKEISVTKLASLIDRSGEEKAWERLLVFLSFRPRSEKEVQGWLVRKKVEPELGEQLFNRLKRGKLVDDGEFARWWVRQRASFRPKGKRLVKMELKSKGVAGEVIDEALANEDLNEEEGARGVAEKQMRRLGDIGEWKVREKVMAALARRGYSWEVIKKVVDDLGKKV